MKFPFSFNKIFGNRREFKNMFRVIIESRDDYQNKYYPLVLSGKTDASFAWSAPVCELTIATDVSVNSLSYMSPIRTDDIIRVQVNQTHVEGEHNVWQDLYEGRIVTIRSNFGSNNYTTLVCRGHSEELLYTKVTADYSAGSVRTGTVLSAARTADLTRITDNSLIDTTNSTVLTSYNVEKDTKFVADILRDMELFESYGYIFKTVTDYDSSGTLDNVYASWQPVSTTASTSIQAIEGTGRLVEATFTSDITKLINDVKIYGDDTATQKVGTATDLPSDYNVRSHVDADLNLLTDALCTTMAESILDKYNGATISGTLKLVGGYGLNVGDLLHCDIPSLSVDGAAINDDYRVKSIAHSWDAKGWFMIVQVGELRPSVTDILAGFHTKLRQDAASLIA